MNEPDSVVRQVLRVLGGMIPALLTCAVPSVLVYLDVAVFKMECDELGIVELGQSVMLFAIVILMALAVRRRADLRGGLVLACAFFLDMLLREQDQIFELWLPHGAWTVPVALVTVAAFAYASLRRESVWAFIGHVRENRHFSLFALGFFAVVGYSRIFGIKDIWRIAVGMDDFRVAKHVAEEGVELFGYTILLYWAIWYFHDLRKEASR